MIGPERKTVFFILPALHGGGAERVTLGLLRAFMTSQDWVPVLVLTTRHTGQLEDQLPAGIEVIRLGAQNGRRAIPKLLSLLFRRQPDVVFTSLDHVNITLGLLQPFLPRKTRLVLRATNFLSLEKATMRRLLEVAFRRADMVIFQSPQMRTEMRHRLRLPESGRWKYVPNPLDRAKVAGLAVIDLPEGGAVWPGNSESGAVRMIAGGRLSPQKGFDLLIDAIRLLNRPDVRLCILGEGELRGALTSQIESLGLQEQVRLCGFQANPYAWFAQADGFILSSRVEGFPNVVLEALACGCPVVATPLPGLEELSGCRLSLEITAEALAEALTAFLASPHKADAERSLKPFDISQVQLRYESLFNALTTNGE